MSKISLITSSYLKPLAFCAAALLLPWSVEAQPFCEETGNEESNSSFPGIERYAHNEQLLEHLRDQVTLRMAEFTSTLLEDLRSFESDADLLNIFNAAKEQARQKLLAGEMIDREWMANLYLFVVQSQLKIPDAIPNEAMIGKAAAFFMKHFVENDQASEEARIFARQGLMLAILEGINGGHSEEVKPLINVLLKLNASQQQTSRLVEDTGVSDEVITNDADTSAAQDEMQPLVAAADLDVPCASPTAEKKLSRSQRKRAVRQARKQALAYYHARYRARAN